MSTTTSIAQTWCWIRQTLRTLIFLSCQSWLSLVSSRCRRGASYRTLSPSCKVLRAALTRYAGYNFKSLGDILRYLEPTGTGISSLWARSQALKHDCTVIVGYPEKVDLADRWPASPEYYNSAVVVNSEGEDVGNYRKSHLYYTDESWALEGSEFFSQSLEDLGKTAIGICMDLK